MAVEFALGIFDKTITLLSFIGILWTVSGALDVTIGTVSFKIPGYMVFAALLYAGIGSVLTYFVGRPIVAANVSRMQLRPITASPWCACARTARQWR